MPAAVSTRFTEVVTGSYQLVSRVEVLGPSVTGGLGPVLLDSANPATPLTVAGGRITVNGSASFRRYISDLVIVDPTGALVPTTAAAYFSPLANNELRLSVGVMVDGVAEYVPQGVFQLEGANTSDTPEGLTITVSAYDRARRYSRARRVTPKAFDASASTPIYSAITSLLTDAVAGTTVTHNSPVHLTPSQVLDTGGDPWEFARSLAESIGYELYFGRTGNCALTQIPDPNVSTLPDWTYAEGAGALLSVERAQSNEEVYNGVVLTGENPSNGSPVRVIVWDDNPTSPTYYLGPYGKVPDFWVDDKVRDVTQATAAATGRLNRYKQQTERVVFAIVPNPAIDIGDAVRVVRTKSGFPATGPGSNALIVDGFSVGLGATDGAMVCTARQRNVA
jgi:hypothetical protein